MENYMMIDGVKIYLTDEQIKMIRKSGSPFSRVSRNEKYYYITDAGICSNGLENLSSTDDELHEVGNYCTDFKLMSQRALHETLNRLLWRFSMQHGESENPWDNNNYHHYIYFSVSRRNFEIGSSKLMHYEGTIYFPTEDLAKIAIEEIVKPFMKNHPDLAW